MTRDGVVHGPGSRATADGPTRPHAWTRRMAMFAPLAVFAGIGVFLAIGLTLDPRDVPSVLIGKPIPQFSLPPVQGRSLGLAAAGRSLQVRQTGSR